MTAETISADERRVKVWDPLIRVFHWTLVVAYFVAYFTEDELLAVHVWAGYLVGGLVVLRIVWGFVGPRHARFADFAYGPFTALSYMADLIAFRAKRYLGHSPAGAVMVLALLVVLPLVVWSGLEVYAEEEGAGPLATISAPALAGAPALADEDEDEGRGVRDGRNGGEGAWGDVHEWLAQFSIVLVLLHIAGVVLASIVHRENLARAMVTGWKRTE